MESLIDWGLPIVQWIQTYRTPFLDVFFRTVSFLGEEDFYILMFPVVYWLLDSKLGYRLAFIFVLSSYANFFFKDLFAAPRPYLVDPELYAPLRSPGFAFPSAHATYVSVTWGYFASQLRKSTWWALAGILTVLVSLARLYLGDHYPQDVIAGTLLGVIFLAGYVKLQPFVAKRLSENTGLWNQVALGAIIPPILAAIHLDDFSAIVLGVIWGAAIGLPIELERVRFDHHGPLGKQVAKFALGIAVVLGLRVGLKAVLPEGDVYTFIRYGVIGLWVILGAPWVFVKTSLSGRARA